MDSTIAPPKEPPRIQTPKEIYEYLDRYIIGQEKAKRTVSIAAYNHYKRIFHRRRTGKDLLKKSNILFVGPTGCGKTFIARKLAECLEVPFSIADATEYTEAGYYGKDVEVMVAELLNRAEMDVAETQRGIVFIDEIDKLARAGHGARTGAGNRDIGGEGVQQSLLKILEGREIFVPYNITQHWNKHDFVKVDTSDILFIAAGTFDGMKLFNANEIGFGGEIAEDGAPRRAPMVEDFVEYGMIPELMGRMPVIVDLHRLSDRDLYDILVQPPDSILKEYRELLALDKVNLVFTKEALQECVRIVRKNGLGARGFRTVFEEVLHEVMFDAPEIQGREVTITRQKVEEARESINRAARQTGEE